MGRYPRPNLPGAAFHVTARLQNGAHLWTPALRSRVVQFLGLKLERSDAQVLAYAIMSNHLHLVVVQGLQPLERLMQPWLLSAALATHRVHGTEGHVFERRFRGRICRTPAHVRNSIAYTHANPVKAGMCFRPEDYPWSSHALYVSHGRVVAHPPPVDIPTGLGSFAPSPGAGTADERGAYLMFLDKLLNGSDGGLDVLGDQVGATADGAGGTEILEGLADGIGGPHGFTLDDLRSRYGPRSRLPVRRELIVAASEAGYSGKEIADSLALSESAISRTLARARTRGA